MVKSIIRLFVAGGADGGTATSGNIWTRVPYTDIFKDPNGIILQLFANGAFRLKKGVYSIKALQTFFAVNFASIRIVINGVAQNVGNVVLASNSGDYAQDSSAVSEVVDQIIIASDNDIIEIQYQTQAGYPNSGLGSGDGATDSVFGYVEVQVIGG